MFITILPFSYSRSIRLSKWSDMDESLANAVSKTKDETITHKNLTILTSTDTIVKVLFFCILTDVI